MLNELELLSQNIGRLIAINERHLQTCHTLEAQLAQLRADHEAALAELAQLREARQTLQIERDSLSAKIDDAQVRLNAILEKLPQTTKTLSITEPQLDPQLDLLAGKSEDNIHNKLNREENL